MNLPEIYPNPIRAQVQSYLQRGALPETAWGEE